MDRSKHRRLILLGLVLLAAGVVLLLDSQWMSASNPVPAHANAPTSRLVENVVPATIDAAVLSAPARPSATPSATATGFRGTIIDAVTRQPVKQFAVHLIRVGRRGVTEEEPIVRSFESATGQFSWDDVAAGTWRAAVSAADYQMFNLDDFKISSGMSTGEFVMPLLRGFAVRGHVFDLSTRAAIVDAGISFRQASISESLRRSRAFAKSKEDGSFMLDGIPAGDIVLTVSASNHAYRELVIVVDEATPVQEIALSTGGTIAGTVTTTAGVPVKGSVRLEAPGAGHLSETNDNGQFSYSHMGPGRYRVSAQTNAGSATQEFVLQHDEIKEGIALIVGAGRSVRGTIRGLRPELLQDTQLLLRTESENASLSARPDVRGAYAMNGVPAGRAS